MLGSSAERRKRRKAAIDEAELLRQLQHINIVCYYDAFETDNERENKKALVIEMECVGWQPSGGAWLGAAGTPAG